MPGHTIKITTPIVNAARNGTILVFFPILINVLSALRHIDPDLVNLARSFKASRARIFWNIDFPASMPALFSGLRIGSTL